ncbi:MAG: tRNA (adenosine(37)-N6)-dimethylallyltransferase MiaA [Sphingobacteriaceae bacterium]|nr:tRNA (adenosine(37)-N6)-dimethylallyltransferase MiaA [Sphingobacteriaceae bacterium]
MKKPLLVCIVGPTAVGKTNVAITLAQQFSTEIVSADSRQFFKEMSIGTAKPTPAELAADPHHFINSHSITEAFSVGDFEKSGLHLLEKLFKKHSIVFLVGGSGLYVQAITQGFDNLPKAPPELRAQLNEQLAKEGIEVLQKRLEALDPTYYAEVDICNPQRIIRALEVCMSTGQPFSTYRTHAANERPFEVLTIGLNTERSQLYDRINKRVDAMMEQGLLAEVEKLLPHRELNALQTVGYQELFNYFDGKKSLEKAVEEIKQNTRHFAKRQLTWFRKNTETHWLEPQQLAEMTSLINKMLKA